MIKKISGIMIITSLVLGVLGFVASSAYADTNLTTKVVDPGTGGHFTTAAVDPGTGGH